jgi:hypothetical protein
METKRYSTPNDDKQTSTFLGKILVDGLSQKELNNAYDDVSGDYDQVWCQGARADSVLTNRNTILNKKLEESKHGVYLCLSITR